MADTPQRPQQAGDLELIGSLLPNQHLQKPRPTATEAWQVLVDLLADISREFRDEAQLTESVSRAYNLIDKAKITDIGVFTAKIYEARAITKSRYATIKRRMPYFFSVLSDLCGLKPTNAAQPPASGQESWRKRSVHLLSDLKQESVGSRVGSRVGFSVLHGVLRRLQQKLVLRTHGIGRNWPRLTRLFHLTGGEVRRRFAQRGGTYGLLPDQGELQHRG